MEVVLSLEFGHYVIRDDEKLENTFIFGAEADSDKIELLLSEVKGKDITELIASGREKLASVPSGGGAVAYSAPAAAGGGGAAAPAAAEQKEEKVEEKEESDDVSILCQMQLLIISSLLCLQAGLF
ncbi:hypothetical protein C1H46_003569 [Malus baccata]|uniref:60S acidic ribosomal protein P2 n=1 Tax=Malus baccata TaxID=106549 RepID=A0A540NIN8_MALBA|nr:hypothetical protein C1H46_003569 [Malus baccata]